MVDEMAAEVMAVAEKFSVKATQEMGSPHKAGLFPYIKEVAGGAFRPDVRVVILKIKEQENAENQGANTSNGGEVKESAGSEESTEAPVTTG